VLCDWESKHSLEESGHSLLPGLQLNHVWADYIETITSSSPTSHVLYRNTFKQHSAWNLSTTILLISLNNFYSKLTIN